MTPPLRARQGRRRSPTTTNIRLQAGRPSATARRASDLLVLPRAVSRFHVGRRGLPRQVHRVAAAIGVRAEVDRLAAVAPLGGANVGGGDGMGFCSHAQRVATGQFHLASARGHLPCSAPHRYLAVFLGLFVSRYLRGPSSRLPSCSERPAGLTDARFGARAVGELLGATRRRAGADGRSSAIAENDEHVRPSGRLRLAHPRPRGRAPLGVRRPTAARRCAIAARLKRSS